MTVQYSLVRNLIRSTRQARGKTQAWLAKKMGISQARLARIESMPWDKISILTYWKAAKALDVNASIGFLGKDFYLNRQKNK